VLKLIFSFVSILFVSPAPPKYKDLFGSGEYRVERSNRDGLINLYDADIRLTDTVVGAVHRLLLKNQLNEDSIILIVSDHGEGFWEHDLFEHGNSLYNELLRIVLILHAPDRLPKGIRVSNVASMVDVFPTIFQIVGIKLQKTTRGQSLLEFIKGDLGSGRLAYSEHPHSKELFSGYSIQSDSYKVVFNKNNAEKWMSFDLTKDPLEKQQLEKPDPSQEAPLLSEMERIRNVATKHRKGLTFTIEEPSKEMVERLRSLGYIK